MPEIPPNVTDVGVPSARRFEALEAKNLDLEARFLQLQNREQSQRILLRWIAMATGVFVVGVMIFILTHLLHHTSVGPFIVARPAFAVAMIVAPITSITTITVALFVGAFRKFEEKDVGTVSNGLMGARKFFERRLEVFERLVGP